MANSKDIRRAGGVNFLGDASGGTGVGSNFSARA